MPLLKAVSVGRCPEVNETLLQVFFCAVWVIVLCVINTLFTFKLTYEVNMNSHMKKLKLSVYTLASDPNFPERHVKKKK